MSDGTTSKASPAGFADSDDRTVGLIPAAKPFSVSKPQPAGTKPYRDFSDFLSEHFSGKVQKISINAGFTCPNRDGSKGYGGCTYCNNQSFSPGYGKPILTISQQLEDGIKFFSQISF